jgi:surface polysaccharide O-acyltransferase-like enzyme
MVPCFFLISGYFLYNSIQNNSKVKKYIWRILLFYIVWTGVYSPFRLEALLRHPGISGLLTLPEYHLWYLGALIIGVLILFAVKKLGRHSNTIGLVLAVCLFLTGAVSEKMEHAGFDFPYAFLVFRRYFLFGFPYLFIGYFIRHKGFDKTFSFNPRSIIIIGILFLLLFLEAYSAFGFTKSSEFYFIPFILCPIIFTAVLRYSKYTQNDGYVGDLSAGVYYAHVLFIKFITGIFQNMESTGQYILIVFFTLLASAALIEINKRIKIFF